MLLLKNNHIKLTISKNSLYANLYHSRSRLSKTKIAHMEQTIGQKRQIKI